MEEESDKFIILKSEDYAERNKKLTLFGFNSGKITAVARGVRTKEAKLKFLCLPFCFCDIALFKNGKNYIVKTASLTHSFLELTRDNEKYIAASVVLEVLLKFESLNNSSFLDAIKTLKFIEEQSACDLYVIKFLTSIFFDAFNLNFSVCNKCGVSNSKSLFVHFATGELVCEHCVFDGVMQVKKLTIESINKIHNLDYEKLETLNIENEQLQNAKAMFKELISELAGIQLKTL